MATELTYTSNGKTYRVGDAIDYYCVMIDGARMWHVASDWTPDRLDSELDESWRPYLVPGFVVELYHDSTIVADIRYTRFNEGRDLALYQRDTGSGVVKAWKLTKRGWKAVNL